MQGAADDGTGKAHWIGKKPCGGQVQRAGDHERLCACDGHCKSGEPEAKGLSAATARDVERGRSGAEPRNQHQSSECQAKQKADQAGRCGLSDGLKQGHEVHGGSLVQRNPSGLVFPGLGAGGSSSARGHASNATVMPITRTGLAPITQSGQSTGCEGRRFGPGA